MTRPLVEPGEPGECAVLAPVLREINTVRGTAFRLGRRLRTGEQGASLLHAATGQRFVLKWSPGGRGVGWLPAVVATLDQLRNGGYPLPRYVTFGVLASPPGRYSIQERLPGHAVWRVDASVLNHALALNDLADAQTFGLYLCHMVHRQVDWSIRHHDPAMIAEVLGVSAAVLADVARCAGAWVRHQ